MDFLDGRFRCEGVFDPIDEVVRSEGRVIEIPVSYSRRRGGELKHSSRRWHGVRTGLRMVNLILRKRFNVN